VVAPGAVAGGRSRTCATAKGAVDAENASSIAAHGLVEDRMAARNSVATLLTR
jgi:hypothetical protein